MKIEHITVYPIALTLKHPFKTAHGLTTQRPITLIKIMLSNHNWGIGEVQSFADTAYVAETQALSQQNLTQILPKLIGLEFKEPSELIKKLANLTPYSFVKAAIEMAIYDVYGKITEQSLQMMIGGQGRAVKVGRAIGLQSDNHILQNKVDDYVNQGYERIKLKIDKATDLAKLAQLIQRYPQVYFSLDANGSWHQNDISKIMYLDQMGISLLEQPFGEKELALHYQVQNNLKQLKLSLDESINSLVDVKNVLTKYQHPITRALTIKQGKLGGITAAKAAINMAEQYQTMAWIGGMLTTGVGRAVDLALSSLPTVHNFPGDNGSNADYFENDIINEPLSVIDGKMQVPDQPGLGVSLNWSQINEALVADIKMY